jgi:ABC-type uncharacterized transport system fused permease/ATPase subunit
VGVNNFCQSCPAACNSVYLQSLPTFAGITETSLPVVVPVQYAATMLTEMQRVWLLSNLIQNWYTK